MADENGSRRSWRESALAMFVVISMALAGLVWTSSDSRGKALESRTGALEVAQGKTETRHADLEKAVIRIDKNLDELTKAVLLRPRR